MLAAGSAIPRNVYSYTKDLLGGSRPSGDADAQRPLLDNTQETLDQSSDRESSGAASSTSDSVPPSDDITLPELLLVDEEPIVKDQHATTEAGKKPAARRQIGAPAKKPSKPNNRNQPSTRTKAARKEESSGKDQKKNNPPGKVHASTKKANPNPTEAADGSKKKNRIQADKKKTQKNQQQKRLAEGKAGTYDSVSKQQGSLKPNSLQPQKPCQDASDEKVRKGKEPENFPDGKTKLPQPKPGSSSRPPVSHQKKTEPSNKSSATAPNASASQSTNKVAPSKSARADRDDRAPVKKGTAAAGNATDKKENISEKPPSSRAATQGDKQTPEHTRSKVHSKDGATAAQNVIKGNQQGGRIAKKAFVLKPGSQRDQRTDDSKSETVSKEVHTKGGATAAQNVVTGNQQGGSVGKGSPTLKPGLQGDQKTKGGKSSTVSKKSTNDVPSSAHDTKPQSKRGGNDSTDGTRPLLQKQGTTPDTVKPLGPQDVNQWPQMVSACIEGFGPAIIINAHKVEPGAEETKAPSTKKSLLDAVHKIMQACAKMATILEGDSVEIDPAPSSTENSATNPAPTKPKLPGVFKDNQYKVQPPKKLPSDVGTEQGKSWVPRSAYPSENPTPATPSLVQGSGTLPWSNRATRKFSWPPKTDQAPFKVKDQATQTEECKQLCSRDAATDCIDLSAAGSSSQAPKKPPQRKVVQGDRARNTVHPKVLKLDLPINNVTSLVRLIEEKALQGNNEPVFPKPISTPKVMNTTLQQGCRSTQTRENVQPPSRYDQDLPCQRLRTARALRKADSTPQKTRTTAFR